MIFEGLAVFCVFMAVMWFLTDSSDGTRRLRERVTFKKLPVLDDADERRVCAALLLPFPRDGTRPPSEDEEGVKHLAFHDSGSTAHVHVMMEHSSEMVMLSSGRHMLHHLIFTYTFTFEASLPEDVRLYTRAREVESRPEDTWTTPSPFELVLEDPTGTHSSLHVSFPEGFLVCASDFGHFDEVYATLAHEQRGEASMLMSVHREANTLTCAYSGTVYSVLADEQLEHITRQQLRHALSLALVGQGWDGRALVERAAEMVLTPAARGTAASRSLGAKILLHLCDYELMARDEQASALRARLYDDSLEWDYTQFAQGLPAAFLEGCEVSQLEAMARESTSVARARSTAGLRASAR